MAANYSVWRNVRLSSFQIGSAMGEILTASIWNRIMISELGMPATPVGLLLVLQYILLPISLYVGDRSDRIKLFGRRRVSYIWLGRGLVLLSFPLLGMSIGRFTQSDPTMGWLLATIAFLLFGCGKLASGSVFLALVRESAPPEKRGLAIAVVETTLIALFPIVAIAFGRAMETYSLAAFWRLVMITFVGAGFFWWFAVVRTERETDTPSKRPSSPHPITPSPPHAFRSTLQTIWADASTRAFFIFLGIATFAAWMQDNILEPFGDDVFELPIGVTTRFTGYWGGMTVIVLLGCFWLLRGKQPETQGRLTQIGLIIMAAGMSVLAVGSFGRNQSLLIPSLLIFGGGFGLYTFGGLSLMAVMSPTRNAGAYLGLWTACILLTKGAGTFTGSALRDITISFLSFDTSYAVIFAVSALGLLWASQLVTKIDYAKFSVRNESAASLQFGKSS